MRKSKRHILREGRVKESISHEVLCYNPQTFLKPVACFLGSGYSLCRRFYLLNFKKVLYFTRDQTMDCWVKANIKNRLIKKRPQISLSGFFTTFLINYTRDSPPRYAHACCKRRQCSDSRSVAGSVQRSQPAAVGNDGGADGKYRQHAAGGCYHHNTGMENFLRLDFTTLTPLFIFSFLTEE